MRAALEEAMLAKDRGEVPIGAVITDATTDEIVARAGNRTIELNDPSAHAEILAIRQLCDKNANQRIPNYNLYVTLEPCTMCAGAIAFGRLSRLIYGASDPKGGAVESGVKFFEQPTCHHKINVTGGILAEECGKILKDFFKERR